MISGKYLEDTRHPWACALIIVPLLVAYEGGHVYSGETPGQENRNGAETWLRMGLAELGCFADYAAPALVLGILVAWSILCRSGRPQDLVGVLMGMIVESVLFAVGLYVLSLALLPLLDHLGVLMDSTSPSFSSGLDRLLEKALRYLGAGIYEETMFRLGLFSILCWLFRLADLSFLTALLLASIISALAFAGAHHLGESGEPFDAVRFLFRTLAGFYFAWLYRIRGLGIAVGAIRAMTSWWAS